MKSLRNALETLGLAVLLCVIAACQPRSEASEKSNGKVASTSLELTGPADHSYTDSLEVSCPAGPQKGMVTIRPSPDEKNKMLVEPDSIFRDSLSLVSDNGGKANVEWRGNLNGDNLEDLVLGYNDVCVTEGCFKELFAGCGKERYVLMDGFIRWDFAERSDTSYTGWRDYYTFNINEKGQPYPYRLRHRFDEAQRKYVRVPGSAQYGEMTAKSLGMNPDDQPRCSTTYEPPYSIRPKRDGASLDPGTDVEVNPRRPNDEYAVAWRGNLNADGQQDLLLEFACRTSDSTCVYEAFAQCEGDWYAKVYDGPRADEVNVTSEISPDVIGSKRWRVLEVIGENIYYLQDTLHVRFDGSEYPRK